MRVRQNIYTQEQENIDHNVYQGNEDLKLEEYCSPCSKYKSDFG
jgi:hypothetical protein